MGPASKKVKLALVVIVISSLCSMILYRNVGLNMFTITMSYNNNSMVSSVSSENKSIVINSNVTESNAIKKTKYLIYQCIQGNSINRKEHFSKYRAWHESVEKWAKYHNYSYIINEFDIDDFKSFIIDHTVHPHIDDLRIIYGDWRPTLIKIWCVEFAILKYDAEWIVFLDNDVSVPPESYKKPLSDIFSYTKNKYNKDENDIVFLAQDSECTMNSGFMMFHKTYNKGLYPKHNETAIYTKNNPVYIGTLMDPKLQILFDLAKYAWFTKGIPGDQDTMMEAFIIIASSYANMNYSHQCINITGSGHFNDCYNKWMNKMGFIHGKRHFGPYVLVDNSFRINQHDCGARYSHNDFFYHGHYKKPWMHSNR